MHTKHILIKDKETNILKLLERYIHVGRVPRPHAVRRDKSCMSGKRCQFQ